MSIFVTNQTLTAKTCRNRIRSRLPTDLNTENIASTLDAFFKLDGRPKILEFESGSKEAKELFLRFKEKIKNAYAAQVSWKTIKEYKEILFQKYNGIARISINRPEKHNAFTPLTVQEMIDAMYIVREDTEVGVVVLTGEGGKAFCSGGDQSVRGHGGYVGSDTSAKIERARSAKIDQVVT